jgi:hypothetical protein
MLKCRHPRHTFRTKMSLLSAFCVCESVCECVWARASVQLYHTQQWNAIPTISKYNRTDEGRQKRFNQWKTSWHKFRIHWDGSGNSRRTVRLDICVLSILNNTNCSNQHCQSLPKYRPDWTICSQHCDYHHSGPLHDVLQQTASHYSRCK